MFKLSFWGILFGAIMYADKSNAKPQHHNDELFESVARIQVRAAGENLLSNVSFRLFTRANPTEYNELLSENSVLPTEWKSAKYDPAKPTFFVTHGWQSSGSADVCNLIRDAYLENSDVNVIVVDWSSIANKFYDDSVAILPDISKRVAEVIKYLVESAGTDIDKVTLVGHSLGAHLMGIAGNNTGGEISTIFGLDPAFPLFDKAGPGGRLSISDAKYVQVIHTNAGSLGYDEPLGHADFYPNGGRSQPGCPWAWSMDPCYHGRAYEFFAESINSPTGFYGRSCETYQHTIWEECDGTSVEKMGGIIDDHQPRGIFYLYTNEESPYAKGKSDL